jgi:ATP-dependent Clp protease ATP-binding subunit ClpA
MDAGNMLKPMLARGELRMIGATTLDEYRERIEKDPALERRFQQVFVGEPSVEDTVAILRGLRERYEAHHKVRITDGALVAAASLSTATSPAAAARQGHRPDRRGRVAAADGDRLLPGGDRPAAPRRRPA